MRLLTHAYTAVCQIIIFMSCDSCQWHVSHNQLEPSQGIKAASTASTPLHQYSHLWLCNTKSKFLKGHDPQECYHCWQTDSTNCLWCSERVKVTKAPGIAKESELHTCMNASALRYRPLSFRRGVNVVNVLIPSLFLYFSQVHPYLKWSFQNLCSPSFCPFGSVPKITSK